MKCFSATNSNATFYRHGRRRPVAIANMSITSLISIIFAILFAIAFIFNTFLMGRSTNYPQSHQAIIRIVFPTNL